MHSSVLNAPNERWDVRSRQEKIKIVNQEAYDKFMAKINEFSTKTAQIRQVSLPSPCTPPATSYESARWWLSVVPMMGRVQMEVKQ